MPIPVKFINTHDSINKKFPPMFELKKKTDIWIGILSCSTCTPSAVL